VGVICPQASNHPWIDFVVNVTVSVRLTFLLVKQHASLEELDWGDRRTELEKQLLAKHLR
jgi:hypothetical protein